MDINSQKDFNQVKADLVSYIKKGKRLWVAKDGLESLPTQTPKVKDPIKEVSLKDLAPPKEILTDISESPKPMDVLIESPKPMDVLDEYKLKVAHCMKCSLSQSRQHSVFGDGNIHSMLYIVGEAPGRDEDLSAIPFVGRSGQLLTKMLEAVAIDRKDVFITNIVKCRPPDNRDPQLEEIDTCKPHLMWQIKYGNPKYILTLGRFSTGYFLNNFKSSLTSLRGVHEWEGDPKIKIVPTFHPAAVLRSPTRWKPIVWEDLKNLASLLLKEGFYNQEQKEILKKNKVI